ncbi:MAG: GAF domain-containing protein [Stagnimonas sp.]|nr:GAF domain-containing protein [Stagnimonas sp.]
MNTVIDPHLHTDGKLADGGLGKVILRLVRSRSERMAIEAGEIDAILDPESGSLILLPEASRTLSQRRAGGELAASNTPERHAGLALDALGIQVGLLDANGVLLLANQAWRAGAAGGNGFGAKVCEHANYLAACDAATGDSQVDGAMIAAGIRQVLAGQRDLFRYDHADGPLAAAGRNAAVDRRRYQLTVTRVAGAGAVRALLAREDVSEHKRGERLLALEYAVARCLADAVTPSEALTAVIRAVCESLGWDCGRYFRPDPATDLLRFDSAWGLPTEAVQQFLQASRPLLFRPGTGLKGRVYQSGQPHWVVDGFAPTALAPATGAEGAFVFPVRSDAQVIGVLAFSGAGIREPDDRLLQAVRAIGGQLGQFLLRQQAAETLRRDAAHFRALTELSCDWHWQQDRELRFTHLEGSSAFGSDEVLGKRSWELPSVIAGGSDWGSHRAQLAVRWSFHHFEFTVARADGQRGRFSISGEPVYDAAGTFTGYRGTGIDLGQGPQR